MTLHFGLKLDGQVYAEEIDGWVAGPVRMLDLLSEWLGVKEKFRDFEYIRIEVYRKAVELCLQEHPGAFFHASFTADPFATAAELIRRRDELKFGDFDFFESGGSLPERLALFANIEKLLLSFSDFPKGEPEIFAEVVARLPHFQLPFDRILLYDKVEHFPPHWQKIIAILEKENGVVIQAAPIMEKAEGAFNNEKLTDLQVFQQMLATNKTDRPEPKNDGSLIIVRVGKETDLAEWLAKILKENPSFQPVCLLPESSHLLDTALWMDGVPTMGISSASSAHSVLQLLKLVTVFLWDPIDPYRVMEFLSLPLKPLDNRLSAVLSRVMSEKPGLFSDLWEEKVNEFLGKAAEWYSAGREAEYEKIKERYHFWFKRNRQPQNRKVSKSAVISVFEYLQQWAVESYIRQNVTSLLLLASQSEKIVELLQAISAQELSVLELERIVRTVYASAPLMLGEREKGSMDFFHHGGALMSEIDSLVWWNFSEQLQNPPEAFWTIAERDFLNSNGYELMDRSTWSALQIAHRNRAVFAVRDKLLLLIPAFVRGTPTLEHALMAYIKAAFNNHHKLEIHPDFEEEIPAVQGRSCLTEKKRSFNKIEPMAPEAFINIAGLSTWKKIRDHETPTSIEELMYYPHKWAFTYKARLQPGTILSVAKDSRLMGNLAHRVFELMLLEDFTSWSQSDVAGWIDFKLPEILAKEGATLLLYGREQERSRFIYRLKFSAWSLISMVKNNGWRVTATEKSVNGWLNNVVVKGKMDLLLERGAEKAIIDLKWSGYRRRKEQLKNEEDLQLVMYANLCCEDKLPHTAYFIIDGGKMLSRHKSLFAEAETVDHASETAADIHQRITDRINFTLDWRLSQLENGLIEVRTAENVAEIEAAYSASGVDLFSLLEMKQESASWDDFKVLTYGIR